MKKLLRRTVYNFNVNEYRDNCDLLNAFAASASEQGWSQYDIDIVVNHALSGNKKYLRATVALYTDDRITVDTNTH